MEEIEFTTPHRRVRGRTAAAFTLIELLLVMMIIAILATVVATRFTGTTEKARISKANADIQSYKTALRNYELDNGHFPTTDEGLNALVANPGNLEHWKTGGYLEETKVPLDPWGHAYIYRCPGSNGRDFDVISTGPSGQEGNADNIGL